MLSTSLARSVFSRPDSSCIVYRYRNTGREAALQLRPADAAFDEEAARLLSGGPPSDSGGAESGRSSAPGESRDTGSSSASWIWAPESLTDFSAPEQSSGDAQPAAQPAEVAMIASQLSGAGSTREVRDDFLHHLRYVMVDGCDTHYWTISSYYKGVNPLQ